jgi:hypothetical protein
LNYWLTGPRAFGGLGTAISLILAIGYFAAFAVTFHLLLAGLKDRDISVRYRRDSKISHKHLERDTSWLYAPPRPWPKVFDPKGIAGQTVNQPLRLLHTETKRTYLEEQIATAKWTIRMGLRELASYAALLDF